MDKQQRTIHAARLLTSWGGLDREIISIEAALYRTLFLRAEVIHTVHDQDKNPVFLLVNRLEAISSIKEQYDLLTKGDDLSLPGKTEASCGTL